MQEEVSEQRGNRAALRRSHCPVLQGAVGHQHRGFQPALYVDQEPFQVRMMRDRLLRQIPGIESKNALMSISITQLFLKHRSRHTATASRAERPGRYPKESSWNTFSSSGSSTSTATVCATLSATFINQSDPAPWLHPHYRASQLLRASPPACLATGTQPLTVSAAWSSPSRRHPWRQFRGDTFTRSIREPRPGSCCLYAGHHLGSKRVT